MKIKDNNKLIIEKIRKEYNIPPNSRMINLCGPKYPNYNILVFEYNKKLRGFNAFGKPYDLNKIDKVLAGYMLK